MSLYTKCIYEPVEIADGLRIYIAGRCTDDSGKIVNESMAKGFMFDEWWKTLAPPSELFWKLHKERIGWEDFTKGYQDYMEQEGVSDRVLDLAKIAKRRDVSILCTEKEPHVCHRSILAQKCGILIPELDIVYK